VTWRHDGALTQTTVAWRHKCRTKHQFPSAFKEHHNLEFQDEAKESESTSFSKENVQELQDCQAQGCRSRHLQR